jgi:nucleotide-binding universal stress UspA family protein
MMHDFPPRKILVPLDGSDTSFRAAKYEIEIAKIAEAEIIFMHAVVNPPYVEYEGTVPFMPAFLEQARRHAELWYVQAGNMATKADVKFTTDTILDVASPADSIVNYAERVNADLIVIGTKGRTGLKRVLLGSAAGGVVSHAACPVVVTR